MQSLFLGEDLAGLTLGASVRDILHDRLKRISQEQAQERQEREDEEDEELLRKRKRARFQQLPLSKKLDELRKQPDDIDYFWTEGLISRRLAELSRRI